MTSSIIPGLLVIMISIVITREEIISSVPVGMPEQEMLEYFSNISDHVEYHDRYSRLIGTSAYELGPEEKGYYLILIDNVRSRWWLPSLGSQFVVTVAVSKEGSVSDVMVRGQRIGWL